MTESETETEVKAEPKYCLIWVGQSLPTVIETHPALALAAERETDIVFDQYHYWFITSHERRTIEENNPHLFISDIPPHVFKNNMYYFLTNDQIPKGIPLLTLLVRDTAPDPAYYPGDITDPVMFICSDGCPSKALGVMVQYIEIDLKARRLCVESEIGIINGVVISDKRWASFQQSFIDAGLELNQVALDPDTVLGLIQKINATVPSRVYVAAEDEIEGEAAATPAIVPWAGYEQRSAHELFCECNECLGVAKL